MNNSVPFTILCNHYLISSKIFSSPQNPVPTKQSLPISPIPPSPGNHQSTSHLYEFIYSWQSI